LLLRLPCPAPFPYTTLFRSLASGGTFADGGAPDLDALLREQATELDRGKREATLRRLQQLVHERAMFAPLYDLAFVNGVGRRVEDRKSTRLNSSHSQISYAV